MAKVKITITGVPEKEPKLHENGNIDLVFKVEPSTALPKGLEPLKECLCLVHVAPKTWKKVAGKVEPERKLLVQGEVKASVNKRGIPFLEMVAMDIGIIERDGKEEEGRGGEAEAAAEKPKAPPQATKRKLKLGTPKGTVKVVALSSIHLPEDVTPLDPEKIKEVVEFVQAHRTFLEPIIVGKEKNVLVDGYEWYVAAKELNIERVPVAHYKPSQAASKRGQQHPQRRVARTERLLPVQPVETWKSVPLSQICIPEEFLLTTPNPRDIAALCAYVQLHH